MHGPLDDAATFDGLPKPTAKLPPVQQLAQTSAISRIAQLSLDTGIPVENLSAGLSPVQVATLASKAPNTKLVCRLSSGARFVVHAQHAAHVLRCIDESCIDRIRDLSCLAEGSL